MSSKSKQSKIPQKTGNAAQRISAIEKSLQALADNVGQALQEFNRNTAEKINILADEIDKLTNSLQSVGKRVNAVTEATGTKDEVNQMLIDSAVVELEGKVADLVKLGAIERDDSLPITDRTFVVGREVDADGNVVNPRVQFATASLSKNLQDKLLGSKVGDLVQFEEGQPKFEITEMYLIKQVEKDVKFEEEAPEASGTQEAQSEGSEVAKTPAE